MHPYASLVLQNYYKAIGWNEDNLYSNLTRASTGTLHCTLDERFKSNLTMKTPAILDFQVPRGVQFHISKSPHSLFNTTYSMNALPNLNGSVGYIFTTADLSMRASQDVRLKDIMERFKIYDLPRRPEGKMEQWLDGERIDTRGKLFSLFFRIIRLSHCKDHPIRLPDVRPVLYPVISPRCPVHNQNISHTPSTRLSHI